jgi:hypothetical protein
MSPRSLVESADVSEKAFILKMERKRKHRLYKMLCVCLYVFFMLFLFVSLCEYF